MKWWSSATERSQAALIELYKDQNAYLRHQLQQAQERVDRLTEALSRKAGVDLILPLPEPPPQQAAPKFPNPWKDPNPVTLNFEGAKS